jgi:hypothetical protein
MRLLNNRAGRARLNLVALCAFLLLSNLPDTVQSAASTWRARRSSRVTPTAYSKPSLVQHYQGLITSTSLSSRLYFLASDLFEGRETTTRGQRLAAEYLASQYREMGLVPKGTGKSDDPRGPAPYFQSFPVFRNTPKETRLEVEINGSQVASSTFSAESHDDLSYFLSGGLLSRNGGVVFAGYGIADDKLGYNDYAALAAKGVSVEGKWVMILEDEPLSNATTSLLPTADHRPSVWTTVSVNKRRALVTADKPKGLLIISDVSPRRTRPFALEAAQASTNARRLGALALNEASDTYFPTYAISTKLAEQILAPSGQHVADLKQQINETLRPAVFAVPAVDVNATVTKSERLNSENVLAFIEGSDPKLKEEIVVISAHYDHLGRNSALEGDQIFNGAADDGSGIVASLELARAFMQAKNDGFGPRRSILFANFSGEEKGLIGSAYYTSREPVIPLEKTVADIQMDGVGGVDANHPTHSRNYIYVVGAEKLSDELIDINSRIKQATGIDLDLTPHGFFNSDQYNFQLQFVPFIYYSTGLTEHYHRPSDEANTIDYEHLARVTQLIFGTAWQVANQVNPPSRVERSQLSLVGYVCPPCPFECDSAVYEHPGTCPVCGMTLVPKYVKKQGA